MYMRIYNNELIKVYSQEDLNNSEIIGKLKGSSPVGFTLRDDENNIVFYDINEITAKELQLIIRNSTKVTIALKLDESEVIDYFYDVAKLAFGREKRDSSTQEELYLWMNASIDSGIMRSSVWEASKPKVIERLSLDGLAVIS